MSLIHAAKQNYKRLVSLFSDDILVYKNQNNYIDVIFICQFILVSSRKAITAP